MSKQESIFRQGALEHQSTPERLDELIEVTSTRSWIALGGILLLLAGVVAWSLTGTVTTRVDGRGILLGGAVYDVAPVAGGRVSRMLVAAGDVVEIDQLIAEVEQPALQRALEAARGRVQGLEEEATRLAVFDAIGVLQERVAELEAQLLVEQDLLQQGLITAEQLRATRQIRDQARQDIEQKRRQQLQFEQQRAEARRELNAAQARLRDSAEVRSPRAGRVLSVLADAGELLTPGVPILKLDLSLDQNQPLRVIAYVPTADGKRIEAGMQVHVAPDSVKPEEHGYMLGKVSRVAGFPSTTESMMQVLRNDQLVRRLAQDGAPFQVQVELLPHAAAQSGYRWTSRAGPAQRIGSGTPCIVRIGVLRQRPIELVVPSIRRALKLY